MDTIDIIYGTMMGSKHFVEADERDLLRDVIPEAEVIEVSAADVPKCPCCHRLRTERGRETLNEPSQKFDCSTSNSTRSLFDSLNEDEKNSNDQDDTILPGILRTGVGYVPKKVLVEGWLHKKGTGKDIFGSKGWKPRYARLVLAKVDGFDTEVPLLLLFWFHASVKPTTVISLDSTVVMAINQADEDDMAWDKHCFNVVHVKDSQETTRTFTAPRKGRDAWVFAINKALLHYSKAKSPQEIKRPRFFDPWDRFNKRTSPLPRSPPTSPRSNIPRPIPRPDDILAGESILLLDE